MREQYRNVSNVAERQITTSPLGSVCNLKNCRTMFLDLMLDETNEPKKKEKYTKTERKRVSETQRKEHKRKEEEEENKR